MDKKTVLAIVLSVVIIIGSVFIQNLLFPPSNDVQTVQRENSSQNQPGVNQNQNQNSTGFESERPAQVPQNSSYADPSQPAKAIIPAEAPNAEDTVVYYENDTVKVGIDTKGAQVVSIQLLKQIDGNKPVEMIMPGKNSGLKTLFGDVSGASMDVPFLRSVGADNNILEFYRDFFINDSPGQSFRVTKRYTFFPNDYLFQLDLIFENSVNNFVPLDFNGSSYTLSLGPQIGPLSSKINGSNDFRHFVYLNASGKQVPGVNPSSSLELKERVNWVANDGKYFSFFIIPGAAEYKITLQTEPVSPTVQGSQVYLSRELIKSSKVQDTFRIYAGPKLASILSKYNKADENPAKQNNLGLDKVADQGFLWWLEDPLKWIMQLFNNVVGNWGISIILLTILVKALLYPLSKKSMESNIRMQAFAPKMTELREKYKDNPQKLNQEMAEIYRKEKINPLGGCLPLLLQFPFFFAMYNIFNNHFDLRNAMFIPGWITDLSQPESILNFGTFRVPFLNWNDLRLLPIIYLLSQFLTTKMTQVSAPSANNNQMKIMMYGLPAVFFFILYDMPSGLLVYWIFQNLLSIVQQQYMNRHMKKATVKGVGVVKKTK